MTNLVLLFAVTAICITSCGTAKTGIYPFPVRIMVVQSISIPEQIVDGETHTLHTVWTGGADPFTVVWSMNGATVETLKLTTGTEKESTVDVTFLLEDEEPGVYNGLVQILDSRDAQCDYPFTYTVSEDVT